MTVPVLSGVALSSEALTWDVVIATYKREEILPRCLRLVAAQTRPPARVIVVDASPGWEAARALVMTKIAPNFSAIQWRYDQAERASSAAQRNQGLRACAADVVFYIDDDSLLYPDAAEVVMSVYERDREKRVAGVSMIEVRTTPEDAALPGAAAPERATPSDSGSWFRDAVRSALKADEIFVPYDATFPDHLVPESLREMAVGARPTMTGNRVTYRRELALREPFEEMLARYAAGEDSDQSYRVSRHGVLLTAFEAKMFHVGSPGGRLPPRVVTSLGAMNPMVLTRIHCSDLVAKERQTRSLLRRRLVIEGIKDMLKRDFSLPRACGIWDALANLSRVYRMDEAGVRRWYPEFQERLIQKHAAKG